MAYLPNLFILLKWVFIDHCWVFGSKMNMKNLAPRPCVVWLH